MTDTYIDTHLHLCDERYDADRQAAIARAQAAGVSQLIEIAESPASWESALRLAESHPFILASLGIHPHHAHEITPEEWPAHAETLKSLLRHPKAVAVGEFGLDYYRMRNTKEQQDALFRQQLALARELEKPVVIHCRDAHADVQKVLRAFYPETSPVLDCPRPAGVIHCFSGSWSDAQTYLARRFLIGVDAPITYPSSKGLREILLRLPLQRIVLETDSPYLPTQDHRGQRNEPSYLPAVAQAVAQIKRKSVSEIAQITTQNARNLFRLNGDRQKSS